ncbi:hypothetical protein CXB51_014030 [Gossypium anomalum]|uniref:Retrotransposon gag domain-containing protein n=1 Tax=Gossypium anomalum TaxID=47600 RepID=A0A8J6D013_9ROSI|nr:hypothetical protein CXB51_014030 [Gossypium anomalum]
MDLETLYNAWERYKDLLSRCPHHGIPLWLQVQTFYNGVNPSTRQMIDAAASGTINNKIPEEAYEFIEEMSLNNYQCGRGVHIEYQPFNPTTEEEQVNYIGNNNFISQNNPYSNTYNAGWRNHPNFSWGGQGNQRPQNPLIFQQPPYQQEKKPNLEEMLSKFISVSKTHFQDTKTAFKNQQASIQGLKTQIGLLSKLISERPLESLCSNTKPNPKEHVKAVTLRSGKVLAESEKKLTLEAMVSEKDEERPKNIDKPVQKEYTPPVPY